jgi:hypothetical protein
MKNNSSNLDSRKVSESMTDNHQIKESDKESSSSQDVGEVFQRQNMAEKLSQTIALTA